VGINVLLELHKREDISVFVLAECLRVLLDGDVGEVYKSVVRVVRIQNELV